MIGYLDTSAFVPLPVAEPESPACRRFWDDADAVVACRLLYVEAAAALAQAQHTARLDGRQYGRARHLLDGLWVEVGVIELDETLAVAAADAAHALGLRGYDAVHCVAAEQLADEDLVALPHQGPAAAAAWSERGLSTYDTND